MHVQEGDVAKGLTDARMILFILAQDLFDGLTKHLSYP
jgi:hypothetical protein